METLSIRFKPGALSGRVLIPGSKSISNRLLVMAYLAGMDYHPDNLSTADDTVLMQKLLGEVAAQRPRRAEGRRSPSGLRQRGHRPAVSDRLAGFRAGRMAIGR